MIASFFSHTFVAIGVTILMLVAPVGHFFAPTYTPPPAPPEVLAHQAALIASATPPVPAPLLIKKPTSPIVVPTKPVPVVPVVPVTPPTPTTTPDVVIGSTTIAVDTVPLLTGGVVHAGQTVPVSYLQITNTGSAYAKLSGFWLMQTGSASMNVVISLSTVDDRGGSRGFVGGTEDAVLFNNGSGYAPVNSILAPGEMRLFTIKATLTNNTAAYIGTEMKLEVTSLDSTAAVAGPLPIFGTTWSIAP